MTFKAEKPGIFLDVYPGDYLSDCCPKPSLTQSLAKVMLERSPLHAWYQSPSLNPDYKRNDDTKFDIGNIAHALLIGRGREVEIVEGHDDWRTKSAQEKRAAATAMGKLAVLGRHYALADRMVDAARIQLAQRGLEDLFNEGSGEVVMCWQEEVADEDGEITTIWLRQMIDWLTPDRHTFVDFKTTEQSASPLKLGQKMWNDGWQIQAAMAERGLDNFDPSSHGRRDFLFVCQEVSAPFALTVARVTEAPLTMGRKQLDWAVEQWALCMRTNRWPGYPTEIVVPTMPGWAEQQWLTREIDEADSKRRDRPAPPLDRIFSGG